MEEKNSNVNTNTVQTQPTVEQPTNVASVEVAPVAPAETVAPVEVVNATPTEPANQNVQTAPTEEVKPTEPVTVQPIPVDPVVTPQQPVETLNTNNKKKGNNFLVIFLVLIILAIGGYVVYDKFIAADEPNNEVSENNNVSDNNDTTNNNNTNNNNDTANNETVNNNQNENNNTSEDVILIEKDCHDGDGCKFTKGKFNFQIVNLENESVTGEALYINGNKAIEDGWIIIDEDSILVLDDIAVVRVSEGLDHFSTFYIYDLQGKQLLNGKPIDSTFGNYMILDFWNDEPALSIDGNKIKINASRFTHGPSILGEASAQPVINQNTSCDTIVMGTYEIEYYGNGKLSEIKNTGYITLKEAILNHGFSDYSNYVTCK